MKVKKLERSQKSYYNKEFLSSDEARTIRILAEFLEPEARFKKENIADTIVFFGSARILPYEVSKKELKKIESKIFKSKRPNKKDFELNIQARMRLEFSKYYEDCLTLSKLLTEWSKTLNHKNRFVVCSGGGPGIMEAANKGAYLAGGKSIGLNISLPHEQYPNPYITPELNFEFHYFFMRKLWFMHLAKALVVFPGGFGTMDELMEMLTLIQTKKVKKRIPIILYGSEYWKNIINFDALVQYCMISKEDLNIFHFSDTPREAFEFLKDELIKNDQKNSK
jgi:uncharacterized protein (TIGR00730 family)